MFNVMLLASMHITVWCTTSFIGYRCTYYLYVQGSEMEKTLANEIKAREQLQIKYENLQKLIQVNFSEFDHKVNTCLC